MNLSMTVLLVSGFKIDRNGAVNIQDSCTPDSGKQ